MNVSIYLCSYDGLASHYCGVGSVTKEFIRSLPEVRERLNSHGVRIRPFVVSPPLKEGCLGWDESLLAANMEILEGLGGGRILHADKYGGTYQYGDLENWSLCSRGASVSISEHMRRNDADAKIVIGLDTPYAALGRTLDKDAVWIWIPHSTGIVHEVDGIEHDQRRFRWEHEGVQLSRQRDNCYLGAIGDYMREHLVKQYGADKERIVMLRNGMISANTQSKVNILNRFGFESADTVIYATGRAERYKGFGDLVKAFQGLDTDTKLLIVASQSTEYSPVFDEIQQAMHGLGDRAVLGDEFLSQQEMAAIVRDPRTLVVVTPSHGEPFGLLILETRAWMIPPGPVLVSSDRHGLKEQVAHGEDGLLYKCGNPESLAMALERALGMSVAQKCEFYMKGKTRVNAQHHYPESIERFVMEFVA